MEKNREDFEKIAADLGKKDKSIELSQMFGKPCIKVNGKAFACFFEDEMVFKLGGDHHKKALDLKGSKLFDPSGKGRAMKEWVQVKASHKKEWKELAAEALNYCSS
ncbi:MAG: hypothetical protein ACJ76F_02965 [Bacteroidia bacterium]